MFRWGGEMSAEAEEEQPEVEVGSVGVRLVICDDCRSYVYRGKKLTYRPMDSHLKGSATHVPVRLIRLDRVPPYSRTLLDI